MEMIMGPAVIVFGLILGSFFNVLIVRLPHGEFLKHARSVCSSCGHVIRWHDNIPLLSFAILKGRCRDCGAAISPQYPLIEGLTALLAFLLYAAKPWPLDEPFRIIRQAGASFLLLFLLPAAVIDLRHRIIPHAITLPGIGLALVLAALPGASPSFPQALQGAGAGGGALLLIGLAGRIVYRKEAMGMGDVKLMVLGGALLGLAGAAVALILSFCAGAMHGMVMKVRTGQSDFPFGPALCLGILLAYLFGPALVGGYLNLF